jgi:hypothetical protein
MKRNWTIVLGVAVGFVAAALAVWAVRQFGGGSATDQTVAAYRAQPLVGLVLADNPAVETELRHAIEDDRRQPQSGPSKLFIAVTNMRQNIIAPTVAAADDTTALAVMKARAALVGYLQKHDLAACRQFASTGIQDIAKLDDEGQQLFRATLAAMEAAYRNGKANGGKGTPPSAEAFADMMRSAGFTDADFTRLGQVATLNEADFCALEVRIDEAPDKLPVDKRGPYARFVITR